MGNRESEWESLRTEYEKSFSREILDKMLRIFWEPRKDIYQKKVKNNTELLASSNKLWAGGKQFLLDINRKTTTEVKIVWFDKQQCFYENAGELKEIRLGFSEKRGDVSWYGIPLAWNAMPDTLLSWVEKECFLYYDLEVFKCFLQIASFEQILPNVTWIFINRELENYMLSYKITWFDYVINFSKLDSVVKRLNNDRIKVGYDSQRIYTEGGLYPDKIFYVIRMRWITSSLAATLQNVLIRIKQATDKGYIPVIDWSYFWNIYLEDDELYKINPWEYFFNQPTMYSLKAAYHAQNIILSSAEVLTGSKELEKMISDKAYLCELAKIYKQYIYINPRVKRKLEKMYQKVIGDKQRVLGVVYRGTDYRNRDVTGEYRQPLLEDTIYKTKRFLYKWKCNYIFLATEDQGALEAFQSEFGDQLTFTEKMRYPADTEFTFKHAFHREADKYYKQEEYLMDIFILSKCTCLLSSRVGILLTALVMNENQYENQYIYDLGFYGDGISVRPSDA